MRCWAMNKGKELIRISYDAAQSYYCTCDVPHRMTKVIVYSLSFNKKIK